MTIRNNAKAALIQVNATKVDVAAPEYDRADMIARLAGASAEARITLLRSIPMGEVAAIGGRVAGISQSVNEVLAMKMSEKHGSDWAHLLKMVRADLCDTDKQRRKDIDASLEGIRETIKSNTGGNDEKARDTLRRVKEWGAGVRKSKSEPNANKKRALLDHLVSWDVLPALYRRIQTDEGAGDSEMQLGTAIATYFQSRSISPRAVLDCKGQSEWNK